MIFSSPFTVPAYHGSSNVDAMLIDASSRMANASLHRQLSTSSSAHSRQPRASRISKPASASSSPQRSQRRRALTSSRSARQRPELPQHYYTTYQPCYNWDGQPAMPFLAAAAAPSRPLSWHPSSTGVEERPRPFSMYEMQCSNSQLPSQPYHTVNINGLPTPMTQAEMDVDVPPSPYFGLDHASDVAVPPSFKHASSDYYIPISGPQQHNQSFNIGWDGMSTPLENMQYPYTSMTTSAFASALYSNTSVTHAWGEPQPELSLYTAPSSPSRHPGPSHRLEVPAPTQTTWSSAVAAAETEDENVTLLPHTESKELVGMGLYDVPERLSFDLSSLSGHVFEAALSVTREVVTKGRGLKLEETWEPPEEEDEVSSDEEEQDGDGEEGRGEHQGM